MADYINNVAAADGYSDALTVGPNFQAKVCVITVANNPALLQFAVGVPGHWRWTDEREFFSIAQTFKVGNIIGVRFRNAVAGQAARILATLSGGDDEPVFESGLPFTGTLSATGAVSVSAFPPATVLAFAGATAPAGFVLCDGSTYDGTDAAYTALWNELGVTYGGTGQNAFKVPDLQARTVVGRAGAGGHVDVDALGDSDGLALAARRPKHKHTVGQPVLSQAAFPTRKDATGPLGIVAMQGSSTNDGSYFTPPQPAASPVTVGPQTGSEPTDTPAYLVLNYIIAL